MSPPYSTISTSFEASIANPPSSASFTLLNRTVCPNEALERILDLFQETSSVICWTLINSLSAIGISRREVYKLTDPWCSRSHSENCMAISMQISCPVWREISPGVTYGDTCGTGDLLLIPYGENDNTKLGVTARRLLKTAKCLSVQSAQHPSWYSKRPFFPGRGMCSPSQTQLYRDLVKKAEWFFWDSDVDWDFDFRNFSFETVASVAGIGLDRGWNAGLLYVVCAKSGFSMVGRYVGCGDLRAKWMEVREGNGELKKW